MAVLAALQELTKNYIKALEDLDADAMIAPRLPDCITLLSPKSIGIPPLDNAGFRRFAQEIYPNWKNYKFTVHNIITDPESKQVVFQASSVGDTSFGPYVNEVVVILHATEDGTRLKMVEEVLDSLKSVEFTQQLKAAKEATENAT